MSGVEQKVDFEEGTRLLADATPYGSTDNQTEIEDDDSYHYSQEGDAEDQFEMEKSVHLGKTKVGKTNLWASMRFTQSFADFGHEYEPVPTLLKENVALLLDPNLDPHEKGHFYYAESAFYNVLEEPHYALTVNADIYKRVINEIDQSKSVPCGLYFCCHGGDGAHTGVSHVSTMLLSICQWACLTLKKNKSFCSGRLR